jgi:hypothetical protein
MASRRSAKSRLPQLSRWHDGWVMDASVRALRRRRRRYALVARRHRMLRWLRLPAAVRVPGGRRVERYAYLFWRVRLPLWAVLGIAGWLALGAPGVMPGLAVAFLVELVRSYRTVRRAAPVPTAGPGPGQSGVREPRRPRPSGDSASAQRPAGPVGPGVG